MIERQRQSLFGKRAARGHVPALESVSIGPDRTVPGIPTRLVAGDPDTILGFPVEEEPEGDDRPANIEPAPPPPATDAPEPPLRLVALPRADPIAGIALVFAGLCAAVSLWLPWRQGQGVTGGSLTRQGLAVAGKGFNAVGRADLWEPPVIVIGGALLLLLGVLLFLPARTHRVVGVLALFVAAGVSAGVLAAVGQAGWNTARFAPGLWFAAAVAVLGILGALKAMLTVPRVTLKQPRAVSR
jgi:hypothetical protein